MAVAAGAGQLVLTHLGLTHLGLTHLGLADPQWAQARKADAARIFVGPVHLARPGARYPVRQP